MTRRRAGPVAAACAVAALLLAGCGGSDAASASAAQPGAQGLLDKQQTTVLDQQIRYPSRTPAQVSSSIVQLEPGQETGWHKHGVPMYGYVLEGTLTVEYDAGVTKEYPAGTAFMEAQGVFHNGMNKGESPVRILTVSMGAKGLKNSVARSP